MHEKYLCSELPKLLVKITKWKGFYCSIYSEDTPTVTTIIEVTQLHAAILWNNVEMAVVSLWFFCFGLLRDPEIV